MRSAVVTRPVTGQRADRAGIGLRLPHLAEVAAGAISPSWLEVHPENFLANPHAHELLLQIAQRCEISAHTVGVIRGQCGRRGSRASRKDSTVRRRARSVPRLRPPCMVHASGHVPERSAAASVRRRNAAHRGRARPRGAGRARPSVCRGESRELRRVRRLHDDGSGVSRRARGTHGLRAPVRREQRALERGTIWATTRMPTSTRSQSTPSSEIHLGGFTPERRRRRRRGSHRHARSPDRGIRCGICTPMRCAGSVRGRR